MSLHEDWGCSHVYSMGNSLSMAEEVGIGNGFAPSMVLIGNGDCHKDGLSGDVYLYPRRLKQVWD